jgi:hypothetical protein
MQPGLRSYVQSEDFSTSKVQVVLDCSITTFYDDGGTKKSAFSENYNQEICEAFAAEVRSFMKGEGKSEVLEPVTITLGGQYGGATKSTNIIIDDDNGRLAGVVLLPKSQGKTIAFNALPQGTISSEVKDLAESDQYRSQMKEARYNSYAMAGDFHEEIRSLTTSVKFPLVKSVPILLINIDGQKLTETVQSAATTKSVLQGTATAVVSGLLTGGNYIYSAWDRADSVIGLNALMINENGHIVWNRVTGGPLRKDPMDTASVIFGYIKGDTPIVSM